MISMMIRQERGESAAERMVRARARDVCEQIISVCAVREVSIIQGWAGGAVRARRDVF